MKIFEKVLDGMLRKLVKTADGQLGFMSGKSYAEAILVLRSLQGKYSDRKLKLYHIFLTMKRPRKAFDWPLRRQGIPKRLIRLVMYLYNDFKNKACGVGRTSETVT